MYISFYRKYAARYFGQLMMQCYATADRSSKEKEKEQVTGLDY